MKKKEALHDLIKSLTKNEKRFFKIYASRHAIRGKNNYVKLFEAVDSLKQYNEIKLFRKIRKEPFIKRFPAEKNYLYNMILECLNIYHKDSSIDRQISKYINIARVLFDKKLDEQSLRVVDKVKKLSYQHNRFENIIPLITLLKKTGFDMDRITEKDLDLYYKELFVSLHKLKVKFEYNKISDFLLLKRKHIGPVKNMHYLQSVRSFRRNPFFSDDSKINSFDANMYYLLGKVEYYRILRDFKNGFTYAEKLCSLFESNIERIVDCTSLYLYGLNCFIEACVYIDRKQDAFTALDKIRNIPDLIGEKNVTNEIQVAIFEKYYNGVTAGYVHLKEYKKGISYVPAIEEGIKKYDSSLIPSSKMVLIFNVACLYFGDGQYKQALKWCNLVINAPSTSHREDIFCMAKILNLLIHLELRNMIILPNIIKSTYRFFYKKKRLYKFEILFLKYIKLFSKADTKKEQFQLYRNFRTDLLPLVEDKFETIIFNDIDLIGWIDKKIRA